MEELYQPPSSFLRDVAQENVPLGGSEFGEANLARLIAMTRDPDRANRDWATMLLSSYGGSSDEILDALLVAAQDEDAFVRGEALVGLAARDPQSALPLVQASLRQEYACMQVFEAAAVLAHPSLIEDLQRFADCEGALEEEDLIDHLVRDALRACAGAPSPSPSPSPPARA